MIWPLLGARAEICQIFSLVKKIFWNYLTFTGTFENIESSQLPLRLLVTASDNPNDIYNRNKVPTELFINLIGAEDGIVLVIEGTSASEMVLKRAKLQSILEEQTEFLVSIDHVVPSLVR